MEKHKHVYEVGKKEIGEGLYWARCVCGEDTLVGDGRVGNLDAKLDEMDREWMGIKRYGLVELMLDRVANWLTT